MTRALLVLMALSLTGCGHVGLRAWAGDQYKFCGNRYATAENFEKAVKKQFGETKSCKALGAGVETTGETTFYPATMFTPARASENTMECVTYKCI